MGERNINGSKAVKPFKAEKALCAAEVLPAIKNKKAHTKLARNQSTTWMTESFLHIQSVCVKQLMSHTLTLSHCPTTTTLKRMLFQPKWSPVKLISCITSKEGSDNSTPQTKEFSPACKDVPSAPPSMAEECSLAVGLGSSLSPPQRLQGVLLA